jgi:hypothetical protein
VVIISQDCDILHDRIEDEPYIDFLTGCFNNKRDGNLLHGKNPRKLQIEHDKGTICFIVHNVLHVKKDEFTKINPKHSSMALDKKDIKLIISWIAKRYSRAAFPDEFMNRLGKLKQIDKAKKNPLMDKVSLIFVDITDEELESGQDYKIIIIIGTSSKENPETILQIEKFFEDLFNIPGIEADAKANYEYDITYEIISTYKRFDWDSYSLPENPDVAAPVTGIDTV